MLIAIAVALISVLLIFLYGSARAEARSRFINFMNALKEAHWELRHYGAFTNHFRHSTVTACTNSYFLRGTNYQCEFRGDPEEFRDRGFLAITTNELFLWIDRKTGAAALLQHGRTFPPGI